MTFSSLIRCIVVTTIDIVRRRTLYIHLRSNQDFQRVYRNGKSYANRLLIMYVLHTTDECSRFGVSVSKKVGNSVVRHRITRLVRETYRLNEDLFEKGFDIVVIARGTAKGTNYSDIESAVLHLAKLHHIVKR